MVLQALRLGFSMGTQSPKANGLLQYINTTQREKIDALDERIAEEAGALKAQVSDAFDEGAKCTENGFGYVDEACTSDNVNDAFPLFLLRENTDGGTLDIDTPHFMLT